MVYIEFDKSDIELLEEFEQLNEYITEKFETKHFDLDSNTIALLIAVTPVIVEKLSKIVITALEKNKNIKFKYNGMEFEGLSKEEIVELINKIAKKKS